MLLLPNKSPGKIEFATEPMRNSYSNRNFSIPGQFLLDSEASYHTHPNKSANNFTKIDISTNNEYFTNAYVMVDSGEIYKHDVASGEIKWLSSDTGNPKNDFNYYDYYGISYE